MGTISVNFLSLRTYLVISRRNRSVLVSSCKLFHIKKRPTGQWPCMVKKYKELRWWLYHPLPENALDSFLELAWFLSALIHIWTVRSSCLRGLASEFLVITPLTFLFAYTPDASHLAFNKWLEFPANLWGTRGDKCYLFFTVKQSGWCAGILTWMPDI